MRDRRSNYWKSAYKYNSRPAFDVAALAAQLEKVRISGIVSELPNDTVYIKDKIFDTPVEKWFMIYLRSKYTYILSSPETWDKLRKL